jgi:surface antigen
MSVLERYKQRNVYRKSKDLSSALIHENVSPPTPIGQSSLFDGFAQADEVLPVPQLSFKDDPISSLSGEELAESVAPEASVALIEQDIPNRQAESVAPEASVALIEQDIPNRQVALPPKTLREPTHIQGTGKKSSGTMFAPKVSGKRTLTHAAMIALTFLVVLGVLATVLPLNGDGRAQGGFGSWIRSVMNWSQPKDGNTALIASQIATATAVTQDGFDPGGNQKYAGVPSAPITSNGSVSPSDAGNLNRFFYGQCTYWANMRYHQLTGHWVPWLGNANAWPSQAAAYGWVVSATPHIPSIMAFAPYVQGAGAYGHVAIAESMNGNDITTSNWNAGGAWATTTYQINHPGPGVYFLYYPGA